MGTPSTGPVQAGDFPAVTGPTAHLTDVRTARHDGFDRVVLEFAGDRVPSYRVSYVEPPITEDGSGAEVPVPGAAFLEVRAAPASGVDLSGDEPRETYTGPDRVAPSGDGVVTEVVRTGDFEGQLAWTIGLQQRVPFGVAVLEEPTRLVVAVLHEPAQGGRADRGRGHRRLRGSPARAPRLVGHRRPAGCPPRVRPDRLRGRR
ncbi:hypothetical protein FB380_004716 [Modestobacter marinus]|uniref:AMIN-like domain-containing protein n=1 Tax=Modestobacter marinus TaxID=477641 RepID=A0A846LXJ4_9ACTN|nr:hypothetical protein [Modestobacter marinus]NIH70218.1 hypothetical protein [Modestobacter marinus]